MERIFNELGELDTAQQLKERTFSHKQRISEWLWDESRGIFANRMISGEFVSTLAPTSFFPMAAGIGSKDQSQRMIQGYLNHPSKFGGEFGLPSVTRDDPTYTDNVYWRGRIWAPLNFWVWQGLKRQGFIKEAANWQNRVGHSSKRIGSNDSVEKILTLKLARYLTSLIRMVFIPGEPCWLR